MRGYAGKFGEEGAWESPGTEGRGSEIVSKLKRLNQEVTKDPSSGLCEPLGVQF